MFSRGYLSKHRRLSVWYIVKPHYVTAMVVGQESRLLSAVYYLWSIIAYGRNRRLPSWLLGLKVSQTNKAERDKSPCSNARSPTALFSSVRGEPQFRTRLIISECTTSTQRLVCETRKQGPYRFKTPVQAYHGANTLCGHKP